MAKKSYVLAVDDDAKIRDLLHSLLSEAGYEFNAVSSAFQARGAIAKRRPDLLILDRGLPDIEGVAFLKEMRANPSLTTLPILLLTARGTAADKIEGLSSGSDDYLIKPFSGGELIARVQALLRRSSLPAEPAHTLSAPGILVNLDTRLVQVQGKKVEVTAKEFELLAALLEKPGHVLSRSFLLERVWGSGMSLRLHPKTVDVAIGRLRQVLGPWGKRIVAMQSQGYRLDTD